jgi:ketosteroid isomerase-like protein
MADERDPNETLVVDFFATLSSGDLIRLKSYFLAEASWTPMVSGVPGAGTFVGPSAICDEFLGPVRGLFVAGDPKVFIDRMLAKGDVVFAETHAMGRIRANNAEYNNRYCWAFELQGGKIRAIREYMDSAYVARVLFGQQGQ